VTVSCPAGHRSETSDYCDQCGAPISLDVGVGDRDGAPAGSVEVSSATQVRAQPSPAGERCPRCQTPRVPGDRYCEVDGYDFDVASAGSWFAEVTADRAHFDAIDAADVAFPADAPTVVVPLESEVVTVGRLSPSRGIHPDIDLSGPPEDPGISREHLRLERTDDGRYAVVDCGSTNGTTLNDDRTPLDPGTPVPLADGDRIHLGAWTTITIRFDDRPSPAQAVGASTA
jgi:hypothetical protein